MNDPDHKRQAERCRQIELREGYSTRQLITAIKKRELTVEQALEIEEFIYPLSKWEEYPNQEV